MVSEKLGLLGLPLELLSNIVEICVVDHGVDHAMRMRFVCKTLDGEIIRTLCRLRRFEWPKPRWDRYQNEHLALKYLICRVETDASGENHIIKLIHECVHYIVTEAPELNSNRDEYLRRLCWFAIQTGAFEKVGGILKGNLRPKPSRRVPSIRAIDNYLAVTAYLGLTALSERLINEGAADVCTDFGFAVNAPLASGQVATARLLKARGFKHSFACPRFPHFLPRDLGALIRDVWGPYFDTKQNDHELRTTTLRAAAAGDLETTKYLISSASNNGKLKSSEVCPDAVDYASFLDERENIFDAILLVAAHYGHISLVQYALSKDANIDSRTSWSLWHMLPSKRTLSSPIEAAARNGHAEVVHFLLERGAHVDARTLTSAAKADWTHVVRILVDHGVAVWPCTSGFMRKEEAINEVVVRGLGDMTKLFLDNGFHCRSKGKNDRGSANKVAQDLFLVAKTHEWSDIEHLLEARFDVQGSMDEQQRWEFLRHYS